jgi:murein DD-endopeptidase MepM/ murein hydrolase activator NlpD
MKKNGRTYRIMIIPELNGKRTFSFRVSRFWVSVLLSGVALILVFSVFLMYKSVLVARKLQYYNTLQNDNERLSKENNNLQVIYKKFVYLDSIVAYLEQLSAITRPPIKKVAGEKNTGDVQPAAATEKKTDIRIDRGPSLLPVDGWITQQFTKDSSLEGVAHPGIDIAAPSGVNIKAPAPGIVIAVLQDADYGTMVVLQHEDGFVTRYGHCEKAMVSVDDRIIRGQTIALVGNTGHSSAPHLHYEVIKNGINVDPRQYLSPRGKTVN